MQMVLSIVHVLVAVGLIALVLIQHGRGADAGAAFGSGSSGTLFGARGPATFLSRLTAVLAGSFLVTSLALGYLSGQSIDRRSLLERVEVEEPAPAAPVSDVPNTPGKISSDVPSAPSAPAPAEAPKE